MFVERLVCWQTLLRCAEDWSVCGLVSLAIVRNVVVL